MQTVTLSMRVPRTEAARLERVARAVGLDRAALLKRALREGWIAGAALDAFVVEPLPPNHGLRTAPNLLITPHLASFARETGERVSTTAAQAIVDFMRGQKPQFVVNPEVYASPRLRQALRK